MQATRLLINGIVQGVGFRPAVCRIAAQLKLKGWVRNTPSGVEIVLNALSAQVFRVTLSQQLPRLAKIDSITEELIDLTQLPDNFIILTNSCDSVFNNTAIPADSCVCEQCISEVFNSQSRYYLYPFTSCCDCGPRYTMISDLPYARTTTALVNFPLCTYCHQEFTDPENRRYHAEAICCQSCGPKMDLSLDTVANYIANGNIVALKTSGGYVLVVDATNSAAVDSLRLRKRRKTKPFALMALNAQSIKDHYCTVNLHEQQLLESKQSPIVILEQKTDNVNRNKEIAPNLNTLGFMLPSSPLYYLIFYYLLGTPSGLSWLQESYPLAIVVTSANLTDGSIIHRDEDAIKWLAGIADVIVGYNREIIMPCDDSVILPLKIQDIMIRRSRGYAPQPYHFSYQLPQVLGLGAHQKNTICFTRDSQAYLSQYLGDMSSEDVIKNFYQTVQHYKRIFNFAPQLVVSDLHPDFHTTVATTTYELPHIQLQHHYAHLAATMASCQSSGRELQPQVIGCILDGYGYGIDGGSWGGELILFDAATISFTRLSHLPIITVLGSSDSAELEPWKLALVWCHEHNLTVPQHISNLPKADLVDELIKNKCFTQTTSAGRLFSLISALLGICGENNYEAEAALRLESMVTQPNLESKFANLTVDGKPDISALIEAVYHIAFIKGSVATAINTFYANLGALLAKWIIYHATEQGIFQVAVGGGCWQSRYLLPLLRKNLRSHGLDLLIPRDLPLNDGGISFGQAWYGAQHLLLGKT